MILLLTLALVLSAAALTAGAETACLEGPGFDTPEEAVLAYIEAMNAADVEGMLSTFAIESVAENCDPDYRMESVMVYSPDRMKTAMPQVDAFGRSIAAYGRYGEVLRQLSSQWRGHAVEPVNYKLQTKEEYSDLLESFRSSPLYDLKGHVIFVRWIHPYELIGERAVDPTYGVGAVDTLAFADPDDYAERAALIRVGGRAAVLFMSCAKYSDRWFNLNASSVLFNWLNLRSDRDNPYFLTAENDWERGLLTAKELPAEAAAWERTQADKRSGTRWPLVSLDVPGITVCADPEEAEKFDGPAVWAELHYYGTGGAILTFRVSPALRRQLNMRLDHARIRLVWDKDGITLAEWPVTRFIGERDAVLDLTDMSVRNETDTVTFSSPGDRFTAVFRRPDETLDFFGSLGDAFRGGFTVHAAKPATRFEGSGYATPEEAVLACVKALNRGDAGAVLSTFAVETYARNRDSELQLRWQHLFSVSGMPITVDAFSQSLSVCARADTTADSICWSYVRYASGLSYTTYDTFSKEDAEQLHEAFRKSPLYNLQGRVTFEGWIHPYALIGDTLWHPKRGIDMTDQHVFLGTDDYTELAALIRVGGKPAVLLIGCAEYGGRWYNLGPAQCLIMDAVSSYESMKNMTGQFLWFPEENEARELLRRMEEEPPEEAAVWDRLQLDPRGGERWLLAATTAQGFTVYDDPEEAERSNGYGIWAELHFYRTGGAFITIHAGSGLRQRLRMAFADTRIVLSWTPESIPVYYESYNKLKRQITYFELIRFIDLEDPTTWLSVSEAQLTDDTAAFTLSDGSVFVFRRP